MAASVKLPEITTREHSLLMEAIRTRINYLKDEIKLGDLDYGESRRLRGEATELNDLLDRLG